MFLFDGTTNHNMPEIGELHSLMLTLEKAEKNHWNLERVELHDLSDDGNTDLVDGRWRAQRAITVSPCTDSEQSW